jgi:single-strand DNA-binding protein
MKTNYFELSGFVGNTPDVRFTPNGKTVATFSLYTKERWTDSGGEQHQKTQRHQITAWGAQAEFAQQRLRKGTRVQVVGRIDEQSWGEGEQRQYKTVLIANEIALISLAAPEEAAATEPASDEEGVASEQVASDTKPAAEAAAPERPRRRRAKPAA